MFSIFLIYFLALTDNWWKDCKAGPVSLITRLGTSFFLEGPTNIRDAWKLYIKLALNFFNDLSVHQGFIYWSLSLNVAHLIVWTEPFMAKTSRTKVVDSCHCLRYSFHVVGGAGRSRTRVIMWLKIKKEKARLKFAHNGLSSSSCKIIKLVIFVHNSAKILIFICLVYIYGKVPNIVHCLFSTRNHHNFGV